MPNNNENVRRCDECGVGLDGECYVDGPLLLCTPCAENLDYEREMEAFPEDDDDLGDTIIDTDFF